MSKTYRGDQKDYLKDKYLREKSKREKRKIQEDKRPSRDREEDAFDKWKE